MFNFIGFLFSIVKGIYNTCAVPTQVNRQASVARILFPGFIGKISSSINKFLLDAQINEYNTKLSTNPNAYDDLAISNPPNIRPSHIQSPIQHILNNILQLTIHTNKSLNSPIPPLFSLKIMIFSAHDEQTSWITPPIKLPPCQPPKSTPY